jgi:hypothetical protein
MKKAQPAISGGCVTGLPRFRPAFTTIFFSLGLHLVSLIFFSLGLHLVSL